MDIFYVIVVISIVHSVNLLCCLILYTWHSDMASTVCHISLLFGGSFSWSDLRVSVQGVGWHCGLGVRNKTDLTWLLLKLAFLDCISFSDEYLLQHIHSKAAVWIFNCIVVYPVYFWINPQPFEFSCLNHSNICFWRINKPQTMWWVMWPGMMKSRFVVTQGVYWRNEDRAGLSIFWSRPKAAETKSLFQMQILRLYNSLPMAPFLSLLCHPSPPSLWVPSTHSIHLPFSFLCQHYRVGV